MNRHRLEGSDHSKNIKAPQKSMDSFRSIKCLAILVILQTVCIRLAIIR